MARYQFYNVSDLSFFDNVPSLFCDVNTRFVSFFPKTIQPVVENTAQSLNEKNRIARKYVDVRAEVDETRIWRLF